MEQITLKNKVYSIEKQMSENVFKVTFKDKEFVIRKFEDRGSLELFKMGEQKFSKCGIYRPKIKKIDRKHLLVLQEYIHGIKCIEKVCEHDVSEDMYKAFFLTAQFARFTHIDLDYKPENFIYTPKKMYYLSDFMKPAKNNDEVLNNGICYWVYGRECYDHLKELGYNPKGNPMITAVVRKEMVLLSIKYW